MRKVKYVPQNETSTALLRSPLNRNVPLSKKAVAWTFPNSFVILYWTDGSSGSYPVAELLRRRDTERDPSAPDMHPHHGRRHINRTAYFDMSLVLVRWSCP